MFRIKFYKCSIQLCTLIWLFCLAGLTSVVAKEVTEETPSETAKLNSWLDEQYEKELTFSPISLTFQGEKKQYDKIDDFSVAAAREFMEWKSGTVSKMEESFNYDELSEEAKTSYDLWAYQAENTQNDFRFRKHGYTFNQMTGIHSFLTNFMVTFHRVDTVEDMEAYISRLSEVQRAMNQLIEISKESGEFGVRSPRFAYETVIDEAGKILEGKPFTDDDKDSTILADVKTELAALAKNEAIDEKTSEKLLARANTALLDSVQPAYENLIAYLSEDIKNTDEEPRGVGSLPDGEAYYNHLLRNNTTTQLTSDEIHNIGLQEVERLLGDFEKVKESIGFEGSLPEFFQSIRDDKTNPITYFTNDDDGRLAYIEEATAAIDNIKGKLPEYFGLLPKADLVVKRVESFREQDGAPQHYYPGTPDGSRAGTYYAHLSDMDSMPRYELEVIAYHEGLPGHHMQISIAQELQDIPRFRTQAGSTAYTEGWALYSELLATEIPGTYADDYSRFGRISSEMWRAIRLVVDTGIHAKGWNKQQAIDYFASNSPVPLQSITAEVERYIVIPGQATSYKIGMLEILRLREEAEKALGDDFDIRGFHDAVLGGGALPLKLLEKRVNRWVAAQTSE